MRVVVAPDKFAGTLDASAAAEAVASGWRAGAPHDSVDTVPLSDGGPGFVDVLATALDGRLLPVTVTDPLGRPVPGAVLLVDGTAYVESAQANGLHLLAPAERDPERTSSAGVGDLVRAALDAGARRIVIGLGGSATNDGGAGMLTRLGVRVEGPWQEPSRVDASGLDPRLARVEIIAATDVDSPLLGLTGASAVFGPQKGASPSAVMRLDAGLERWARALGGGLVPGVGAAARPAAPGAGAAGGLGYALLALGARRVGGVEVVLTAVGLRERLAGAGLVVTGEGRYDETSLRGKVSGSVAAAAHDAGLPCVVLAGDADVSPREVRGAGLVDAVHTCVGLAGSVEAAMAAPAAVLARLAERVARQWSPAWRAAT